MVAAAANKDIPPELMGVSVKELVKVIGESRANGNGVTPPGTPATPKRASRSASPQVSSRGSSPSSVRLTSGSVLTTAQRAASKSPLSHDVMTSGLTRQDSSHSENSTSNLVSSLTRDLSHEGSASPSLSMRSEPLRSVDSPIKSNFEAAVTAGGSKVVATPIPSSENLHPIETTTTTSSSEVVNTTASTNTVLANSAAAQPCQTASPAHSGECIFPVFFRKTTKSFGVKV